MLKVSWDKNPEQIAIEIDEKGYSCTENSLSKEDIKLLQDDVLDLANSKDGTFAVVGNEQLRNTLLGKLNNDPIFIKNVEAILRKKLCDKAPDIIDKHQVLRVLNGGDVNSQAYLFHFDAYTLTVLLPIFIPNDKNDCNGDLLLIPNVRAISYSPLKNLIVKVLLQNRIVRFFLKISLIRRLLPFIKIKLKPGNLYFFWGFRSYHGNEECSPGNIRSTALFHFHKTVKDKSFFSKLTATRKSPELKINPTSDKNK
jgi:hypothetical protein